MMFGGILCEVGIRYTTGDELLRLDMLLIGAFEHCRDLLGCASETFDMRAAAAVEATLTYLPT